MPVVSSLGIGSGVLTADIIDKLKENEKSATVTPIETKITAAQQKEDAMSLLESLVTTFKSNASALSQDTLYQKRTVSSGTDDVTVTAKDGTSIQNLSITDIALAKTSVQQSGSFADTTSTIASGVGSMNINIDGKDIAIEYNAGSTLEDLKKSITDSDANNYLTASILQVGEEEYTLVLTSKDTGLDQNITITDDTGNLDTSLLSTTHKSGTFAAADDFIANSGSTGTYDITVGTEAPISLAYDDTTTLTQLMESINSDASLQDVVHANIVQEGEFDFKLVLTPIGTQKDATITIADTVTTGSGMLVGITDGAMAVGNLNEVQAATDASFKYNGITITRDTNSFDDVLSGVSITLNTDGGSSDISITQDRQPIIDELNTFVASYNTLINELGDMTGADLDNGKVGVFNGDNTVRSIGRDITRLITSVNADGQSLAQYGIELNENGEMSFTPGGVDSEVDDGFDYLMDQDSAAVATFFSGLTTVDDLGNSSRQVGIFEQLNIDLLKVTKNNGTLDLYTTGIKTEVTSLSEQHEKTLALLEARYETMTKRFIAYDGVINSLNAQSASLTQQIDMAIAAAQG